MTGGNRFRSSSGSRPRSAAAVLDSTLKHLRLQKKLTAYEAFPLWAEIVGEEVSKVARPEKLIRGRVMVVRVKDAAWLQELSLQKEALLHKLRSAETGAYIEDIRFVTGSPDGFEKR